MNEPFDPTRPTIAEQVIAVALVQLDTGRPAGIPPLQRDRVFDLEDGPDATDLPAMLLMGYEERLPVSREMNPDLTPCDLDEARSLVLHFALYGRAAEGKTATQATDIMASWIDHQLSGPCGAASPFHGLADLVRPGIRVSQLVKGAMPYCLTGLEIVFTTSFLTGDMTRRG